MTQPSVPSAVAEEMQRQEYLQNSRYFDSMKERIAALESRQKRLEAALTQIKQFAETIRFDPLVVSQPEISARGAMDNAQYILDCITELDSEQP